MKALLHSLSALLLCLLSWSCLAKEPVLVKVTATYIDVYTGPGRGYPITYVLEKDDVIELKKQRTDWIKIKTARGRLGWVQVADINQTVGINGEVVAFTTPGLQQFIDRRFELGFAAGDFEGADEVSAYIGWRLTQNISVEAHAFEIVGDFSDSTAYTANIVLQPFPEWRISPFVTLGSGVINIRPDASLVDTETRDNNILQAGIGVYGYISRRFVARIQYNNNKIVTDRNDNEEIDEWRFGLTAFF
ncbi:SH3 domain-containing protein [Halioxenophilus sp. WMMB6]|uniref:SH3 domain-containing protein n=1 Tax=Halioxenophilus sp. WMMB6 TaxID=3073815 RepID=UPI00295EEDE3|nr:SH3 domain-containing protein [Halioxenophilus sp. WMMB6]